VTFRRTVSLDSVQSHANRLEEVVMHAHKRGEMRMPMITLTSQALTEVGHVAGTISVYEMPHRIYSAYLRYSTARNNDGTRCDNFFDSEYFRPLLSENERIAQEAILKAAPLCLLFGYWGNTMALGRPVGKRMPSAGRIYQGEMIGYLPEGEDDTLNFRPSSTRDAYSLPTFDGATTYDPKTDEMKVDIASYTEEDDDKNGDTSKDKKKVTKLSQLNLSGNVVSIHGNGKKKNEDALGGVAVDVIQCHAHLALSQLFRIVPFDEESRNVAARAYLAAAGLYMHVLRFTDGSTYLRSGADLTPTLKTTKAGLAVPFVGIGRGEGDGDSFFLTKAEAKACYDQAVAAAADANVFDPEHKENFETDKCLDKILRESRLVPVPNSGEQPPKAPKSKKGRTPA
jgi:CRISPR-associated protein Csb1